jgi:hypothetical protein
MPLQNRVTPLGELIADPGRGLVYGNRGCLHDETGRIRRRSATKRWIACRLEFRGWKLATAPAGKFTELFFLDEATAFAAGHRPCALCRRDDYDRFSAIWRELHLGESGADAIDARLHAERVDPATRAHRLHEGLLAELPDGAFVLEDDGPQLVLQKAAPAMDPVGLRREADSSNERECGRNHATLASLGAPGGLAARCAAPSPISLREIGALDARTSARKTASRQFLRVAPRDGLPARLETDHWFCTPRGLEH